MAVFSTNQNRQLYVALASKEAAPAVVGDLQVKSLSNGNQNQVFFKYLGKGGMLRSDLIDTNSITYIKHTSKDAMKNYFKEATISLASGTELVAGQDYIVRIYIHNYLAPGDAHTTIKYGAVHMSSAIKDATAFYEALAKSLTQNFSREVTPLLTFEATESGVKVTEVEQPWVPGTMALETVNFEIVPIPVEIEGMEVQWANVEDNGRVALTKSSKYIGNGKTIADLEYFCMGERGDQYRKNAGVNAIPVTYMVDPSKEYDVLDIHYAFSDTGVNVQKSEKDITIVGENAVIAEIKTAIEKAINPAESN
jgi:hypothetical protein